MTQPHRIARRDLLALAAAAGPLAYAAQATADDSSAPEQPTTGPRQRPTGKRVYNMKKSINL